MNATVEKVKNLDELSVFLSEMNNRRESHIGYCGEKAEEIHQTLKEDFVENEDVNFVIARNSPGEIIAAMGLDIDETTAEVWGPFNKTTSQSLQYKLWDQLLNEHPTIETFYFFINKENTQQQKFMDELKAEMTGEHLILEINKPNVKSVPEMKSVLFSQRDYDDFEKIHNQTFPDTYYDAKTIVERLGNGNTLRVVKNKSNELQGYVYFEVDSAMSEASLEYIGVSPEARNQGIGTLLLKEALTEMFSYPMIRDITLTVENTNSQANHVYLKAGFAFKDMLTSYIFERRTLT